MSICYVFDERVVCTPQTSPGTPQAVAGSGPALASPAAPSATPAIRGAGASPQRP